MRKYCMQMNLTVYQLIQRLSNTSVVYVFVMQSIAENIALKEKM